MKVFGCFVHLIEVGHPVGIDWCPELPKRL